MKFAIKGSNENYSSLQELFGNNNFSGSFNVEDKKVKKYTICWKWPYETYKEDGSVDEVFDEYDLSAGKQNEDYIFEIEIKGTQKVSHN